MDHDNFGKAFAQSVNKTWLATVEETVTKVIRVTASTKLEALKLIEDSKGYVVSVEEKDQVVLSVEKQLNEKNIQERFLD